MDELITMKRDGEQETLEDDAPYLAEIDALQPRLDAAFEDTRLPAGVTDDARAPIEDFLWRCRMAHAE